MKFATLVLEDGTVIEGQAFGADADAVFELVFNTSMTGYQEILTDPSYRGQGVLFTVSHIGNVGINTEDDESAHPQVSAAVIHALSPVVSNWRSALSLSDWLKQHNVPGISGVDTRWLTRKLRDGGNLVPVVFLTARDDPADKRAGFTGGGDDYLTKPFSLEELVLRIEAVLRRSRGTQPEPARLTVGDLTLDEDAHRVWRGEREVFLSPTEFRLLRYLMQNRGRVLSKQQILEQVWDYGFAGELTGVETYVSYLRRKIDDRDAQLIRTVRGFGYTLRTPDPDPAAAVG